jgi:hypothetical protein
MAAPTGDRIALTSGNSTELRVVDLATGTVTLLVETDGSDMLSVLDFSPEGDRILFSRTEVWRQLREFALEHQRRRLQPPSSRYWTAWGGGDWQSVGPTR